MRLFEDPLLGADFLQSLNVLEDGIDELLVVGETLLRQRHCHREVRHAVQL